ncbi:MAG: hypothetical protein IJ379_01210 [Lachnospiraceae bacterium]|nr:hypothetical protein [Lachnospiraceae bacterium]
MLKQNVNGEFSPMVATEEEAEAMNSVIDKADKLMEELNAYEELDNSLMEWFLNKYEAQETNAE